MGHDVFISYSTKDKPTADAVCAALEGNGVRCWIAPRDIVPGQDWGEAIVDGIRRCRIMVLVFSANANASPQIRREVERAVNKGVPIIPFRIEEVMPTRSLEYFISTPHWMDAMSPPLEQHLTKLTPVVQTLLGTLQERVTKTVAAAAPTPPVVVRAKEWIDSAILSKVRARPAPADAAQQTGSGSDRSRRRAWILVLAVGLVLIALAALLPRRSRVVGEGTAAGAGDPAPAPSPAAPAPDARVVAPILPTRAGPPPQAEAAVTPQTASPARPRPAPPARVSGTFETRGGVEFDVSPDDAIVYVDGRRIGKADDWDGSGGGRVYRFRRPGTYYARFVLRGYRTTWVKIVVRSGAPEDVVDVDTSLPDLN